MIKIVNNKTYENWKTFRRCVINIKYAHSYPNFSLDESMRFVDVTGRVYRWEDGTPRFTIKAEEIIAVIGKDSFKKLIENLWEPHIYNHVITPPTSVRNLFRLFHGFYWGASPEGMEYWQRVANKIKEIK